MTPKQFMEWLDKEIELYRNHGQKPDIDLAAPAYVKGHFDAYQKVREKFLTLTPPPTTLS